MGREAFCKVRSGDMCGEGKALLETEAILFRGPFRLSIPLKSVTSVEASDGLLRVAYDGTCVELELGEQAEKWAHAILNPKTRLDKLGLKPGMRAALLGVEDADFTDELNRAGVSVSDSVEAWTDMVFLLAETHEDLEQLESLRASIWPNGAIWVISPRGRPEIQDIHVIAAGKAAGLVDTKVCRFSDSHTALKLVVPVTNRSLQKLDQVDRCSIPP